MDLGGGLGISYDGSQRPVARGVCRGDCRRSSRDTGLTLVLEPGRALVGAAGLLLTRVVDVKEYPGGPRFAILDAGMTELLRPALYGAFHRIVAVAPRPGEPRPYEVVGPLCESSDIFGRDRLLPPLEPGDLAGRARHRRVRRGDGVDVQPPAAAAGGARRTATRGASIRRRQTIDDLVALEA